MVYRLGGSGISWSSVSLMNSVSRLSGVWFCVVGGFCKSCYSV